jgi:uncharacterized protein DUF4386
MERRSRGLGVVYLGYFVLAFAGVALGPNTAGSAVSVLATALYLVLVWLLSRRFSVGGPRIAMAGLALGVVGCAIQAVGQVRAMGGPAVAAALPLFGGFCICLGWLIVRSNPVPRVIGILLIAAGVGWLAFSFPPVRLAVAPIALPLGLLAEGSLMLWLLIVGDAGADTQI